MTLVRDG